MSIKYSLLKYEDFKNETLNKPLYMYLMLFLFTTIVGTLLLYLPVTGVKPLDFVDAFLSLLVHLRLLA